MKKSNRNHRLEIRLSEETVADIDAVIATHPQLGSMSRSLFVRYAIHYGLISFEKYREQTPSTPIGRLPPFSQRRSEGTVVPG